MLIRVVGVIVCAAAACVNAGPTQYTFVEIGPRPLQFWELHEIGPQGQIVGRGWANGPPPLRRGLLWQNGSITQLDGPAGETITEARCIDDNGVIYGGYGDRRFNLVVAKMHPARWVAGTPTPYSNNQGINSAVIFGCSPTSGVAVGWAKPFEPDAPGWQGEYGYPNELPFGEADPVRAFVWSGNTGVVLTRGIGLSDDLARAINDAGQVAVNLNGYEVGGAARFDPRYGLAHLPTFGVSLPNAGWSSSVFAINAAGHIVGRAQVAGGVEHPVRWNAAEITDLGLLPGFVEGEARDINDVGTVVGGLSNQNFPFGVAPTAGFVVIGGVMHNLNQLVPGGAAFVIGNALAVNNAGQILVDDGQGYGTRRYALLSPIP